MLFYLNKREYIDTSCPIDISIEMSNQVPGLLAWGQSNPEIEPVRDGQFIGSVKEGGVVNFNNIRFNPHAHLTHTECCGHITHDFFSVNEGGVINTDSVPRPEGIYSLEDIVRTQKQQWSPEEHPRRRKGDHREAKGTPVGWAMPDMLYFPSRIKGPSPK